MNLATFLSQPLAAQLDRRGLESDWLDLCELDITSGNLAIGDPFYFPNYQAQHDVMPGRYAVQAKVFDYGTDRRVSRLRACRSTDSFTAQPVKDIPVDSGRVSACDYNVVSAAVAAAYPSNEDRAANYLSLFTDEFGVVTIGAPTTSMAYIRPGWGNGIYTVYTLVAPDGAHVGREVTFIEDEPYLFEDVEPFQITTLAELREKADRKLREESRPPT
jgi:hypothetical protein